MPKRMGSVFVTTVTTGLIRNMTSSTRPIQARGSGFGILPQ